MITCCAVLRGKREATKSDWQNLSLVNRQDNVSFFSKQKRTPYIYGLVTPTECGFSSLHTRWASGWLADYMSGPVKKINRSYFLAIAVGSHRYSSFIRDVYQSQRDGGQPVREACLATAARPAAHVHPLQRRPAWICARPPHQATTSSTSAPAMLATAPSPSDGGGFA